jgi:hypothetical protein
LPGTQKQFTESAFNDLIRQAACLYHEQGSQVTAIAVNDYENFIPSLLRGDMGA